MKSSFPNSILLLLVFLNIFLYALPGGMNDAKPKEPKVVHTLFARYCFDVMAEGYRQTGLTPPVREPNYVDFAFVFPNGDLLNAMDKYVTPRQHLKYVSEANDCDDIAKEWCVLTHQWWVETTKGQVPIALATFVAYVKIECGAFDGRQPASGGHALGLLCDSDGVWWFVEPSQGWHVKAQEALFEGSIVTQQILW